MTRAPGAPSVPADGAPGAVGPDLEARRAAVFPLRAAMLAVGVHILWGGNPVAVKWGLEVFPPLTSGLLRFSLAVLCLAAWARLRALPLLPPRGDWPALAGLSLLFSVQIGLMNWGFALTGGAIGSILISLNPLFAALWAHLLLRGDRLSRRKLCGLLLAFAGTAVVLTAADPGGARELFRPGNWLLMVSALLLGLRLIMSARVLERLDELRVIVWMMLLSLPLFAGTALATETVQWHNLGWRPLAGLAYQGVVIASLGFMVTSYLMRRYAPSVVVSFNFVSPAAGVLLSAWLLGEAIGAGLLGALVLVAAGLYLIARRR